MSPDDFTGYMIMKNPRKKAFSQWETRDAARPIAEHVLVNNLTS
jgi:hypothetical protein